MNLIPLRQIEHTAVALALCPCGGRRTLLQTTKHYFCDRCGEETQPAECGNARPERNETKNASTESVA